MKTTYAIKVRDSYILRISGAFSMIKSYHGTHADLIKHLGKIRSELPKRVPYWLISYANGFIDSNLNEMYRHYLEYCHKDFDGTLYSVNKKSTRRKSDELYATGRGSEVCNMESNFYWVDVDKIWY